MNIVSTFHENLDPMLDKFIDMMKEKKWTGEKKNVVATELKSLNTAQVLHDYAATT